MKIRTMDGRLVDHRRIRRNVYRTLRLIRAKGYGVNGVDANVKMHRMVALYTLKTGLHRHQRRMDLLADKRFGRTMQEGGQP